MNKIEQYSVYLINLDPTIGHEIKKTRPCVVISPNEMNKYLKTTIIAPMRNKIRTVDRQRFIKKLGILDVRTIKKIKENIQEMLVD